MLFRLGEDLIVDDIQAVAELVKNAYDADSPSVIVRIVTGRGPDRFPNDDGYIEIIDHGHGMDLAMIRRGWLTISNSLKREMKRSGMTTAKGRTPLGDKGLGRLGAQRLGNRLSIVTTPETGDHTYAVDIDWQMISNYEDLASINIKIEYLPRHDHHGTRLTISDLHDPDPLRDHRELEGRLSSIVSPYRGVANFKIYASIDGDSLELSEVEDALRHSAVIHYDLVFDGDNELYVDGRMRLSHLRPNALKDRPAFVQLCQADAGRSLLEFLRTLPEARDFELRQSDIEGWWVSFGTVIRISESEPELVDDGAEVGQIASPGPFFGEIDGFNLSAGSFDADSAVLPLKTLRERVGWYAGIQIYRDGFNIRMPADWLHLGQHWTSGSSWYGLRPSSTLGYIELSARDNAELLETTDREGFRRTKHYLNFEKVLDKFVSTSHRMQEIVGRGLGRVSNATIRSRS